MFFSRFNCLLTDKLIRQPRQTFSSNGCFFPSCLTALPLSIHLAFVEEIVDDLITSRVRTKFWLIRWSLFILKSFLRARSLVAMRMRLLWTANVPTVELNGSSLRRLKANNSAQMKGWMLNDSMSKTLKFLRYWKIQHLNLRPDLSKVGIIGLRDFGCPLLWPYFFARSFWQKFGLDGTVLNLEKCFTFSSAKKQTDWPGSASCFGSTNIILLKNY